MDCSEINDDNFMDTSGVKKSVWGRKQSDNQYSDKMTNTV